MASVIQTNDTGSHALASSWTISFTSTPAVGDAVIVSITLKATSGTPTVSTVVDNQSGNTYQKIASIGTAAGDNELWWCPTIVGASGTFTITVTPSETTNYVTSIMEVNGLTGTVDQQQTFTVSGGTASPITATMTNPNTGVNDLVIAILQGDVGSGTATNFQTPPGNNSVSGAFTVWSYYNTPDTGQFTLSSGYKFVSAIETSTASWTYSTSSGDARFIILATFQTATGASVAWLT